MRLCRRCVLPENFPGIKFNEDGVCQYCLQSKGEDDREIKKREYRERFESLIREHGGKGGYDALMSYSGGKDSTYTLSLLREEYGLNVLAVTFDNGFLPDETFKNIRRVAENLRFDHLLFKPRFDVLRDIFVGCAGRDIYPATTLLRASTICTSCMAIVKFSSLRTALEKNIPFIIFGWSPGQIPLASSIMKNNPQMVRAMQKALFEPLAKLAGDRIRPYFLEEHHYRDSPSFPFNISPLAFLDYDEKKMLEKVRRLGWKAPAEVDANSTNCLLNSFANIVHRQRHGFHPYVFELAKLCREGYLDRSDALEKLNQPEDPRTVDRVKKKLGL